MLIVVKTVKQIIKETGKQSTLEFIQAFDKKVDILLKEIISKATGKRLIAEDIA
jgi:hypothetical protein